MKLPILAWHYTTGRNFIDIVEDGVILPATLFIGPRERPVVWFSLNQFWEPTANKAWRTSNGFVVRLNMEQTFELGSGLVRIGVKDDVAPYNFRQLRKVARISSKMAAGLKEAGVEQGANPSDWRGSLEPVPREKWSAVEVWDGSKWERVYQDQLDADSDHDEETASHEELCTKTEEPRNDVSSRSCGLVAE